MRKAKSFSHIRTSVVYVLARLAARNAVKEQLRDQGVRVTLVPIRQVHEQADEYLRQHPELYAEARERARQLGMIEIREPMVTPDARRSVGRQITTNRALKRLSFFLQLLRFSVAGAY